MCIGSRVAALLIAALNNSMHSTCKTDLSIILPDLFFVHQPGYSTGEISLEIVYPITDLQIHQLQIHQDGYGKATKTIYIYIFFV